MIAMHRANGRPGSRPRFWTPGGAFLLTAALVLAGQRLAAQEAKNSALDLDQKIIALATEGSEIMANLTYLSDIIGPRLTGSENLKRANDWTAEKMKSYGLENVRLEPWELPFTWERGTAHARLVEPDNGRTITLAAMGWSPGTKRKPDGTPIVGDVVIIRANNPEELQKYRGRLKDAIVLRGPPSRVPSITEMALQQMGGGPAATAPAGTRPAEAASREAQPTTPRPRPTSTASRPEGFDNRPGRNPALAFRREMAEFFRTQGVACVLLDSGKPHGLLNMTGNWSREMLREDLPEPVPTAFVTHDHYALLYRLASRPEPARTRLEIEITNKLIRGPHNVYNTVGEIRGDEKPDEFVVVGAHLDSWDLGQGTTDNGTGSSIVLECARILARCGVKPKRTIRFVLFTGEEQGLHGSREYVRRHMDEMKNTSCAIVHDTGTGKVTAIGLQGRAKTLKPIFEKELVSLMTLGVREFNDRRMGGSDHQSFNSAGVPGFMFTQDPAEYRLTHHSQSDTLDKARPDDLVQGAQVMSIMAMRIANLPTLLPRE